MLESVNNAQCTGKELVDEEQKVYSTTASDYQLLIGLLPPALAREAGLPKQHARRLALMHPPS